MSRAGPAEAIILIVDDLMFLPKLEDTLRHLGYQPRLASDEVALNRAIGAAPVLVIVDLFSQRYDWPALLAFIKGPGKKGDHLPVLGFGPHVDLALRERALAAGCTAVVGRGAIAGQLPHLLEKYKWRADQEGGCQAQAPALVREGLALFNQGEYFECHEVLEAAWNEEKGPQRLLYQGLLQLGVACHHIQNKNWRGAMKLLERAGPKIARFAPTCLGLDLAQLGAEAELIRTELLGLGPAWSGEFDPALFPKIEISGP
jgi:hypothetical protein